MSSFSRSAARKAKRKKPNGVPDQTPMVKLTNPVRHHFPAFIVGNAIQVQWTDASQRAGSQSGVRLGWQVVKPGTGRGKSLVICGAGPSLADHADLCDEADEVWGTNSAATWLWNNGHKVTHGYTVDQTPHMVEEWFDAPPIDYLLASSCHPHLVEYLLDRGRRVEIFHNFVGIRDEEFLYSYCYQPTVMVGSGLNAVTRAIDLGLYGQFESIKVIGADCAFRTTAPCPQVPDGSPEHMRWLREHTIMHADGGNALASQATPVTFGGIIDDREWQTKPDMVITAVFLVKMAQAIPHLELIGDTLPNALMDKDDDFLRRLPTLTDGDGKPMEYKIP